MTKQKYKQQIDALRSRIRSIEKARRDETRANNDKKFGQALKKLQAIGLQVTATGDGFNYQGIHLGGKRYSTRYPLSKVTYEPSKDVFYVCAGERTREYNYKDDYHFNAIHFYPSDKNSIRANSQRVKEISLGCLESLVTRAEAARRDLATLKNNGRLRRVSPAVAIETIKQRGNKGLKTGFRKSSLEYSDEYKMVDMLLKYHDLGAVKVLSEPDLTAQSNKDRDIIFFPKLDVYLDLGEGLETIYLYGEKNSIKKVIRQLKKNDEIFEPDGF